MSAPLTSLSPDTEGFVYLASPYSHPSSLVREHRHSSAEWALAEMMRAGFLVFGPIVHCHDAAKAHGLPTDWGFWWDFDKRMLARCDALHVLTIEGWTQSTGVREEIAYARERGLPIRYLAIEGDALVVKR